MRALDPNPGERAYLTQESVYSQSSSTVTYKYNVPPAPLILATPYYNWGNTGRPPNYSTESAAVAAGFVQGLLSNCAFTVTPTGSWTNESLMQPPYDDEDSRTYDETVIFSPGTCSAGVWHGKLFRDRTPSCPVGPYDLIYAVSGTQTPPLCLDRGENGYVTGPINECAQQAASTTTGDPCDVATGDFSQTETDYEQAGLTFKRTYHSVSLESGHSLGVGWTHNYSASLQLLNGLPNGLVRPDGHHDPVYCCLTDGVATSLSGAAIHVQQSGSNWVATQKNGDSEVYNAQGQLIQLVTAGGATTSLNYSIYGQLSTVQGPFGHSLQFSYYPSGLLQQLIDPAGHGITYAYDSNNNLVSATYQDLTVRQYLYENSSFPNNLTGIIDENSNRFLTVGYDSTTGAVRSSQQAGGAQAVSITYGTNSAVATNALGEVDTYTFTPAGNGYAPRATGFSRNSLTESFAVPSHFTDIQQRVTQYTDANGNITKFAYDSDHLTSKTEAYGTAVARTTSYQYISISSALPTLVTEALRSTRLAYFPGTNNVQTKTITDLATSATRIWNYTYNSYGQVLTINDPRTDVSDITTYTYYSCTTGNQCGHVNTVQNALGQTTTFNTYNAYGQPLTLTDPNNVLTTLTYDARQRLKSKAVGSETTGYGYYPTGQLQTVTLPDSSTVTYSYDGAHRLTDITDGLGNHIHYVLDAMGNRTAENAYDPGSSLHRTHTRVINSLNQVYQETNASGISAATTTYGYDNNGNLASSSAPLARNTGNLYDSLNRLWQITDPANGITRLTYDANDQVTGVVDPRALTTSYTNNGFRDLTQVVSPDTGTTTKTYDSGGNLHTSTDARGAVGTYTYDVLNRPLTAQFTGPNQMLPVRKSYVYDNCTYGVGRLCQRNDAVGTTRYTYTAQGRIATRTEIDGSSPVAPAFYPGGTYTLTYGYNTAGQRSSLQMPSGTTINYSYNGNNQVSGISVTHNGTTTPILRNATYEPFGAPNGWTWGNGATVVRSYNSDGNISVISSAGLHLSIGYDNALRATSIGDLDASALNWSYGYDLLDRLTSAHDATVSEGWGYDANGNRLTQTGGVQPASAGWQPSTLTYNSNNNQFQPNSNPQTGTFDAAGNGLNYSSLATNYDAEGSLWAQQSTFLITNGLRQRVASANTQTYESRRVYDDEGHILGEYDYDPVDNSPALLPLQETIYLGDIPVAVLMGQETFDTNGNPTGFTQTIYYIHADHLKTPRRLTLPSNNTVIWRWDSDAFGYNFPNGHPPGSSLYISYNLRFPGQIYEQYLGTYYNQYRDYDPLTGRYLQSDPIGLDGGSYSTYGYVRGNPVTLDDPFGLSTCSDFVDALVTLWATSKSSEDLGFTMLDKRFTTLRTYDGFKPELVAPPQLGQVSRHVYGHAGAVLAYPDNALGSMVSYANQAIDYFQRYQKGRTTAESMAEIADDRASRQVADALNSSMRDRDRLPTSSCESAQALVKDDLKQNISAILCD